MVTFNLKVSCRMLPLNFTASARLTSKTCPANATRWELTLAIFLKSQHSPPHSFFSYLLSLSQPVNQRYSPVIVPFLIYLSCRRLQLQ